MSVTVAEQLQWYLDNYTTDATKDVSDIGTFYYGGTKPYEGMSIEELLANPNRDQIIAELYGGNPDNYNGIPTAGPDYLSQYGVNDIFNQLGASVPGPIESGGGLLGDAWEAFGPLVQIYGIASGANSLAGLAGLGEAGSSFMGAGVDPVVSADAAAGTPMFDSGLSASLAGEYTAPETVLGDNATYTADWATQGGGVDPGAEALTGGGMDESYLSWLENPPLQDFTQYASDAASSIPYPEFNISGGLNLSSLMNDPLKALQAMSLAKSLGMSIGEDGSLTSGGSSLLPLLGLLGGGLLGGLTSQDTTQKSTTSSIPPEIAPYLGNLFSGAQGLLPGAGGSGGAAGQMLNDTMAGNYFQPNQYNPYGNSFTPFTSNPYLGATTQSIGNQFLGQTTPWATNGYLGVTTAQANNPYIGQTTSVGSNPYFGQNNPYLEGAINKTLGDVTSRVNTQFANPNAFGGSANQELLQRSLADASNQMRYQDYGMQAQLGEADVARRLAAQQGDLSRNSQLAQQMSQFNAGLSQADLSRNAQLMQQLGMFNSGLSQTDLARNAALAQQLGQFNAGLQQTDLARNSSLAQNQGQFNAGLYQGDLSRNSNLWNTDMARNTGQYEQERNRQFLSATGYPSWQNQWTTAQFSPYTQYANLLKGWGSTSTQTQPANTGADIFGGALTGYSLANMFQPKSTNLFSAFA